jgi:hypothetical protein
LEKGLFEPLLRAQHLGFGIMRKRRAPPAETAAPDRQLMRAAGRRLAEAYLKDPPLMTDR